MLGSGGIFRFGPGRVLGLSVSDRVIQAAEVSLSDDQVVVHGVGEMEVGGGEGAPLGENAPGLPLEKLGVRRGVEGGELVKFLRERGFTARRVVIGLPARWLLVRSRTLPVTDDQTMAQTLRLQVEHDFAPSSRELVFDYIRCDGGKGGGKSTNVLVVATLAERVRQVVSAAESAGLEVVAVTSAVSAVAALGSVLNDRAGAGVTLHIGRTGSELMVQGGGVQMIRHVGGGGSLMPVVANEVRRVLSQVGVDGGARSGEPGRRIEVWDGVELSRAQVEALGEAVGAEVEVVDPFSGEEGGMPRRGERFGGGERSGRGERGGRGPTTGRIDVNGVGRVEVRRYAGAIALARLGVGEERPALDFVHSRLAEPKKARVSRGVMMAAGVGVVVLSLAGYLTWEVTSDRQELAEMRAQLVEMEPEIEAASLLAEDVGLVGQWFENRPRYLECLREVTLALPSDPPVWVTNLTLQENRGLMAGRTTEQRAALTLLDRLQASGRFGNLQMLDMREAGRGGSEVSFSISFRFEGPGEGSGFGVQEEGSGFRVRGSGGKGGTSDVQRSTSNVQRGVVEGERQSVQEAEGLP